MTQAIEFGAGDDPAKNMTELVTEIARALVDNPESVVVETLTEGDGTVIRLHVAQSDVGKVIGSRAGQHGRCGRS